MSLWSLSLVQAGRCTFADALWLIWGGITDGYTHPRGDAEWARCHAVRAATDLQGVLGDDLEERRVCDAWVYEITGERPLTPGQGPQLPSERERGT